MIGDCREEEFSDKVNVLHKKLGYDYLKSKYSKYCTGLGKLTNFLLKFHVAGSVQPVAQAKEFHLS